MRAAFPTGLRTDRLLLSRSGQDTSRTGPGRGEMTLCHTDQRGMNSPPTRGGLRTHAHKPHHGKTFQAPFAMAR